jgi:hypothetical protein
LARRRTGNGEPTNHEVATHPIICDRTFVHCDRARTGAGGRVHQLTKAAKASWKPASEAEDKARAAGYEVRKSKIEGSCYEVYGVKDGKLVELFYSPEDLSLKHTKVVK